MNKKLLFLLLISIAVLFGINSFAQDSDKDKDKEVKEKYPVAPNKAQIEAMLKELGIRQIAVKEKAAVAQAVEQLPDSVTYHCELCSKDTVHKRPPIANRSSMWPISHLKHDREQVAALVKYCKLGMFLDEEGFCESCTKGKLRDRALIVVILNDEEAKNELQENDLRILDAFFRGKDDVDIQRGTNYQSEPLRNYIPRIRRLLIPR